MKTRIELRTWARSKIAGSFPENSPDVWALEADVLLGRVLGLERASLISSLNEPVNPEQEALFNSYVERRAAHEPVAYIVGEKEFYGIPFVVSSEVLIPRPETELLVEKALPYLEQGSCNIIDVGAGSGCIVLTLLSALRERYGDVFLGQISATAVDLSGGALQVAKRNAEHLKLSGAVNFVRADTLSCFALREPSKTVVVSNPPYIPEAQELPGEVARYEPRLALRAGASGLDVIVNLLGQMEPALKEGAALLFEIGAGQRLEVESALSNLRLSQFKIHQDLGGIDRVVEISQQLSGG